jgi:hypothetical protein
MGCDSRPDWITSGRSWITKVMLGCWRSMGMGMGPWEPPMSTNVPPFWIGVKS